MKRTLSIDFISAAMSSLKSMNDDFVVPDVAVPALDGPTCDGRTVDDVDTAMLLHFTNSERRFLTVAI